MVKVDGDVRDSSTITKAGEYPGNNTVPVFYTLDSNNVASVQLQVLYSAFVCLPSSA